MRSLLTFIAIVCSILIVRGQLYIPEKRDIQQFQLKKIIEWTINIDSVNNRADSSFKKYLFDSLGRLTEMNYEFSKEGTNFISVKYLYNEQGCLVDTIYNQPYSLSFSSFKQPVDSIETIIYDYSRIAKIIKRWRGGKSEELNYNYGKLFLVNDKNYLFFTPYQGWKFMRDFVTIKTNDCFLCKKDKAGNTYRPVYDKDLVDFIEIKINGKLKQQTRFEYTF